MESACAVLCCHVWPVWLYHVFPQYLINGTISGRRELLDVQYVFNFPYDFLSETFLGLRRLQCDIITNARRSTAKVPLILVRF